MTTSSKGAIVKTSKGPVDQTKSPTNKGAMRSNKTDNNRALRSTGQAVIGIKGKR